MGLGRLEGVVCSGPHLFFLKWSLDCSVKGKTCYVISQRAESIPDKGVRTAREETGGGQLGHAKGAGMQEWAASERRDLHARRPRNTRTEYVCHCPVYQPHITSSAKCDKNTSASARSACANHNLYIMFLSVPESCMGRCRDWSARGCLTPAWANGVTVGASANLISRVHTLLSLDRSMLHHIAHWEYNNKSRLKVYG